MKTGIAWNLLPLRQCAEGIFQRQFPIYTVNFTNKMSGSSWTWHNLWKFLTNNLRNKYFHNSVNWSGFIFKCISFMIGKSFQITAFRLLENAFVKLPCPHHHLIINPPCRTFSQWISPKQFVFHLPCKASLHTLWGETLCPWSIGKSCGGVSHNICKKVQNRTC